MRRSTLINLHFLKLAWEAHIGYRLAYCSPKYTMIATKIGEDLFSITSQTAETLAKEYRPPTDYLLAYDEYSEMREEAYRKFVEKWANGRKE